LISVGSLFGTIKWTNHRSGAQHAGPWDSLCVGIDCPRLRSTSLSSGRADHPRMSCGTSTRRIEGFVNLLHNLDLSFLEKDSIREKIL
jgi:hypothetical protein